MKYLNYSFLISITTHGVLLACCLYFLKPVEMTTNILESVELIEIESETLPEVIQAMKQTPPKNLVDYIKMAIPALNKNGAIKDSLKEASVPEMNNYDAQARGSRETIDLNKKMEKVQAQAVQNAVRYTKNDAKLSDIGPIAMAGPSAGEAYAMTTPAEPDIKIEEVGKVAVRGPATTGPAGSGAISLDKKPGGGSSLSGLKQIDIGKGNYNTSNMSSMKEGAGPSAGVSGAGGKTGDPFGSGRPSIGYNRGGIVLVKRTKENFRELVKPAEVVVQKTASKPRETAMETANAENNTVEISGPIAGRRIIYSCVPAYPEWALARHIEQSVSIRIFVSPEGRVRAEIYLERTSGYRELDSLAEESIKKWVFEPLKTGGGDQWGIITFKYLLK
ncbi:MAG: hypothetical protein A2297_00575 [Elusimicrobia bacterium RIFOXYB2_FULL_48_7]|nr:MAG: hypothetical protein A2297_00575 [Elusimicrobia bacterium RIFOXYB2_FULL_48_7]